MVDSELKWVMNTTTVETGKNLTMFRTNSCEDIKYDSLIGLCYSYPSGSDAPWTKWKDNSIYFASSRYSSSSYIVVCDNRFSSTDEFNQAMTDSYMVYQLATPTTIDLTDEEVQAFKELSTYYPTTNVFVTSEQLNGYAEIKYPTTDVSGIASKNEAKIAEIEKNVTSVNNDLGGLKFSVSDGTLSITDGVNTWTLLQTT